MGGQGEGLARPGDRDVQEAALLLRVEVADGNGFAQELAREEAPVALADRPLALEHLPVQGDAQHMLGTDQLDAEHSPQIVLRAVKLEPARPAVPGTLLAHVQVSLRGSEHSLAVPVRYEHTGATVVASGEVALRQTELGITPYSAMLGALQVQDELRVKFRIVARAAH